MNDTRIRFRHIVGFLEIVRCGNVGRAADALNIAQPALSRQIGLLEEDLEVTGNVQDVVAHSLGFHAARVHAPEKNVVAVELRVRRVGRGRHAIGAARHDEAVDALLRPRR